MGTSLSGLTPATTFDGLLKVGDNDPLTATLKPISTGDGTDTMLELSTSALQIGGATGMYWDNTNKRLGIGTNAPSTPFEVYGGVRFRNNLNLNGNIFNSTSGIVNIDGLAYFNGITDKVGIGESTPTSRLHIKGSGATSATTSLLVQNSAGTNIFKVVDDNTMFYHTHKFRSAGGYLYIEGEGNADRSLKIGQNFTASSYDGHIFKTYDGVAYSEAMRITGANDQFIGIGETTPTARLHVKGSGNDATTTSLLVQNSDGTDLFKVRDDGRVLVDEYIYPADGTTNSRFQLSNTTGTFMRYSTGYIKVNPNLEYASSTYGVIFNVSSTTGDFNLNGATGAKMGIKGNGATSATTALLVENSSGTDTLEVRDDGRVVAGTGATTNANGTFNVLHGVSNLTTRVFTVSRDSVLRGMDINSGGSTKISDSSGDQSFSHTATAVLEVSSTTQGFLPPRMTGTQRDAIESPASGLIIYNTTTNKAQCYNGTIWNDMF